MASAVDAAIQRPLSRIETAAGIVYGVVGATTLALWPALATLGRFWRDMHDYQHGFLIAGIAAAWLFLDRNALRRLPVAPSWAAFGALAVTLLAWLVAWRASGQILIQALWPAALLLAVWASAGAAAARVTSMPIAYLYFAIPVWDYLIPALQSLTISVSESALGWIGVPAYVDGSVVTIPEGTFTIVEGCAGKRYLMMALAAAVLLGVLQRLRGQRLALLVVVSAVLAVLMNWLRVIIVILAGHWSNMQSYLVAVEHFSLGWILFGVLVGLIVWVARGLEPALQAGALPAEAPDAPPWRTANDGGLRRWLALPLLAAVVAVTIWAAPRPGVEPVLRPLPDLGGAWQGPVPPEPFWQPVFSGAASEARGAYVSASGRVEVYANTFGPQTVGHKLVQLGHSVVGAEGWRSEGGLRSPAAIRGLMSGEPRFVRVRSPIGELWVVGYRYRVGAFTTTRDALAQLLYGAQALVRELPAGVVAVAARCDSDCQRAADRLAGFTAANLARIDALVPRDITPSGLVPPAGRSRPAVPSP